MFSDKDVIATVKMSITYSSADWPIGRAENTIFLVEEVRLPPPKKGVLGMTLNCI